METLCYFYFVSLSVLLVYFVNNGLGFNYCTVLLRSCTGKYGLASPQYDNAKTDGVSAKTRLIKMKIVGKMNKQQKEQNAEKVVPPLIRSET